MQPKDELRKREVNPGEVLLLLILLNVILAAVVVLFPDGKIPLGKDLSLKITPLARIFTPDTTHVVDINDVVAGLETVDSTLENLEGSASYKLKNEKIVVPEYRAIQYPDASEVSMSAFFEALYETEKSGKLLHVIHYGDSQLEGDRISDYLRNKLQLIFGGYGPGIVLPKDISQSRVSVLQSESPDCKKYAIYGKNERLKDGMYGIGGSTYRFTGSGRRRIGTDTLIEKVYIKVTVKEPVEGPDTDSITEGDFELKEVVDSNKFYYDTVYRHRYESTKGGKSWVKFRAAKGSYPRVRKFNQIKILYGSKDPLPLQIKLDDSTESIQLPAAWPLGVKTLNPEMLHKGVEMQITGNESANFFGFVLESDSGIQVDNFPMRGSSGTGFESMNPALLAAQMKAVNAKLIIIQYGINVVPNPQKNYSYYQRLFHAQLVALKKALPGISILVVGPSDMSTRIDGVYASYPNIPLIRDAMKNAAFANGCAFWDLYEAMGGQNSMVSWVNGKPALAGKDFTHFTGKGAQYVGEMMYDALIRSYMDFKNRKIQ